MLIPEINPDEYGTGYMIRLGHCNGFKNYVQLIARLREQNLEGGSVPTLVSVLLANSLRMGIEQYCQQHTLLPVHRGITNVKSETIHGSLDYSYGIRRFSGPYYSTSLRLCRACVAEDMDYHGYSYYRRTHQLPGAQTCLKHDKNGKGSLYSIPAQKFLNPELLGDESFKSGHITGNLIIDRFQEILEGLCHFKHPVRTTKIVDQLQVKARAKGVRWSSTGHKKLFSDLVLELLPNKWLIELLPGIKNKVIGKRFAVIDGVLSPQKLPPLSLIYILSVAILYDSSDEALLMLHNSRECTDRKIATTKRLKIDDLAASEIAKLYIELGGVASSIARRLKIDPNVVAYVLNKEGMPPLGRYSSKALNGFLLFSRGAPLNESARISGASLEELEVMIRGGCTKLARLVKRLHTHHQSILTV